MIDEFFQEIDRKWAPLGMEPIELRIIGSTALFLQSTYKRGTKDSDILELSDAPKNISSALQKLAGKETRLAKQHALYLDIVMEALPLLPPKPIYHDHKLQLKNFKLKLLDITDVIVSKIKRFNPHDIEDINEICKLKLINQNKLLERFKLAIDAWKIDARQECFDNYIENFHVVQRDYLLVKETPKNEILDITE